MQIVGLDWESYFDNEYTLQKLTTEAYIRDDRFDAHGLALKFEGEPAVWLRPEQLRAANIDWANCAVIAHHAQFDGLILNHHFGIIPGMWIDTLSMARVVFDASVSIGLGSLAERFGLQPKSVPYNIMKGMHWDNPAFPREAVAQGCCNDVELTMAIAQFMMCGGHPAIKYPFPAGELPVVDLTVRMFTEPCLRGDMDALRDAYYAETDAREALFAELGVTGEDLRKDEKFAELLRAEEVEIEKKITAKGNEKYPFARTDRFMQELQIDPDDRIAALVEARLLAHSSIYQTRAKRLGFATKRGPNGLLPVYLAYCAAHTRRWGGGDKMNWQNFPRPDPYKPQKGALRRAIRI